MESQAPAREMGDMCAHGDGDDRVKTAATLIATIPKLLLDLGWSYLKMKRRAKKCSKSLRRAMVEGGMPEHLAKEIANGYAVEISARKLIRNMGIPGIDIRVRDKQEHP